MVERSTKSPSHQVDDAFGIVLHRYFDGDGPEEYESERYDGQQTSAALSHYFDPHERWAPATKSALEFVRPGDRVLDVGCGAGRHALWLQSQGHEVVAIDRSEHAIDVCLERGIEHASVMKMHNLSFDDSSFETVIIIGGILGLGGTRATVRQLLAELDRITTSDGRIIADSQHPFPDGSPDEYLRANRLDDRSCATIRFRIHYDGLVGEWLELVMFGKDELEALVTETPWSVTETIDPEPDEGWYSLASEWYFAVLDKE